ncbi:MULTISPECIES: FAD-dependent oxidoreductase [unclassified Acinetobacter]|uniref:FAD-dependent oxidoreductase n=1 Tax=unclassified Acinetobacter TaxID=196816 RepID=UPI002935298D|nr:MULTISPECIES: FAD-dependent oxidoreductase [unclassified Acinetobacter]WOE31456.1 FAD-dependent oxidoreductase [Acinetobacter sp. SAAs470]WOE39652.1 FAD-dependent oxidoreductase [Acinetobacter sp. SAAs474]
MHPIIIIGSGMAGYTVAREFRKLNTEQELLMICMDDGVSYAKPTLSNAFTAQKAPEQIALANAEKMQQQLNMRIETATEVSAIDAIAHTISITKNQLTTTQNYSKLILAVGAEPIRLNITGDGADDIHVINHLNDYRKFRQQLEYCQEKRVVILGAGLIGCEFANDLQNHQHQVTLIDIAEQPLGRLLPQHVAQQFQQNLEALGIQFIFKTTVINITKTEHQTYLITLANGQSLIADIVLSAVGLQPKLSLAQNAMINTHRGIMTNNKLETNQADIYAVGDCAEVNGTLLPYVMPIMQQARALAKTLNGEITDIHYPAMPIAVKTPASPLTILPVPLDINVDWQTEVFADGILAKAIDETATLRGFVLLGATAGKQRLTLVKQVPDLIPLHN